MQAAALELVIAAIAAWLAIGALGLLRPRSLIYISRGLFPIGAAIALALGVLAFVAIPLPAPTTVLPLGLPDLPFHLRLDSLSAFFLLLLVPRAPRFRGSPPATFAQARVRRRDLSACSITRFWPRWRWS